MTGKAESTALVQKILCEVTGCKDASCGQLPNGLSWSGKLTLHANRIGYWFNIYGPNRLAARCVTVRWLPAESKKAFLQNLQCSIRSAIDELMARSGQ